MNGITKKTFLMEDDPKVRDAMLYEMMENIYKQVSFKRTVGVAFLGAAFAIVVIKSPALLSLIARLL